MKVLIYAVTLLCLATVVYMDPECDCKETCSDGDLEKLGKVASEYKKCEVEENRNKGETQDKCEERVMDDHYNDTTNPLEVYGKINENCGDEGDEDNATFNEKCCSVTMTNLFNCISQVENDYKVDFGGMDEEDSLPDDSGDSDDE